MKQITAMLFLVFAVFASVSAQNQEAITIEGKKVTLKSDGTWEYAKTGKEDISTTTSKGDCNYYKNEVDEFTGKKKIILIEQDFINYTSDELKEYFKNKDYVKCQVYCARIEKTKVAYFHWVLQTKDAYKLFGSIAKGSKILLKFKDGETLELKFSKSDIGDTNYDYGYTTYSSYIILDEESIRILKNKEVEKVRMYWGKGYEDYPVSNPKLFVEQLPCIE